MALRIPVNASKQIGDLAETPVARAMTGPRAQRLVRLAVRDVEHEGIVVEQQVREGRSSAAWR
jgi:hypothetical protein